LVLLLLLFSVFINFQNSSGGVEADARLAPLHLPTGADGYICIGTNLLIKIVINMFEDFSKCTKTIKI
jgi:hypothetical protein